MKTSIEPDPIYLDYNATTPVDPRVAAAMMPYLTAEFGNPSSSHVLGRRTKEAVEEARSAVAELLDADPTGVVFTSGGTEANNHAILGAARANRHRGRHIVTTAVEHPAVTAVCRYLETEGFSTTYVPVDGTGRVDAAAVAAVLTDQTVLVTVMHANNEVGTLQPVAEIAALARAKGILSHTDCAQSVGKVPVSAAELGVDMISVAGHKLYAPKGVGVLWVRPGVALPNLMHGASHEGGRRPGTENVLEIVGLGTACRLAAADVHDEVPRLAGLRDRLEAGLLRAFPSARIHGHPELRLPNTLSIGFPGVLAADIMAALPNVAVSAGAACHGDSVVISHVLAAMKVPDEFARGTLRISVGRMTTPQEVETALEAIKAAVASL